MKSVSEMLYSRGYLISSSKTPVTFERQGWAVSRIGMGDNYYDVHYDGCNQVVYTHNSKNFVFVLGLLLDPEQRTMSAAEIAGMILQRMDDEDSFWKYMEVLCGRYLVVYGNADNVHLVQDAAGMRTCYYGDSLIASHYELLNQFEQHAEIEFASTYRRMGGGRPFYLPGDLTPYERILTLLPNHELDLRTHEIRRIFPRNRLTPLSANEVGDYFAELMRVQANLIGKHYQPILSFTGGNDSRVTLSAFRDLQDKIRLFTYDNHSEYDPARGYTCQYDNTMAKMLAETLKLRLVTLDLKPCDDSFRRLLQKVHYHRHVDSVVPAYLAAFSGERVIHVRSNILETIRSRSYFRLQDNTPTSMAKLIYGPVGYGTNEGIVRAYEDYYRRNQWDLVFDYDASDLLYWEMRMGVWHAGGILLASDIAFDTYCLFNQRKLLRMGLSMPMLFRRSNFLVEYAISKLWPELFFWIPNKTENLLQHRSPFDSYFARWIEEPRAVSNLKDFYKRISSTWAEVGFLKNMMRAGDWISICFDLVCMQPVVRISFLVSGVAFWEKRNLSGLGFRIKINDELILEGSCDALRQKPEFINRRIENPKGRSHVSIELLSRENTDSGENIFLLRVSEFSGYFPSPSDGAKPIAKA